MTDALRYFHPVAASRALQPGPLRAEILGRGFALFRDGTGAAAALADTCPHRFAPLSKGRVRPDGRLACPYHGWNFDAHGSGKSPSQPTLAHCDTVSYQVLERHGYVWMANRDAAQVSLDLAADDFRLMGSSSALSHAPLGAVLEGLAGDTHLAGFRTAFGWPKETQVGYAPQERDDASCESCTVVQRRAPWLAPLQIRAGDHLEATWLTRFDPVCVTLTLHWIDPGTFAPRPFALRAVTFLVPEGSTTTRSHAFSFVRGGGRWPKIADLILRGASKARAHATRLHADRDVRAQAVAHQQTLLRSIYLAEPPVRLRVPASASKSPKAPEAWSGYRPFVVASKVEEADGVCSFYLEPKDGLPLPPFLPGQHLTFRLALPGHEKPIVRCYSLSDRPREDRYRITIKRLLEPARGVSSNHFHEEIKVGAALSVKAPSGNFHLDPKANAPVVLLAGGIGVTPLLAMVHAIVDANQDRQVWLFYGVRRPEEIVSRVLLDKLEGSHPSIRVFFCVSNGPVPPGPRFLGERISVALLRRILPTSAFDYYLCGKPGMMEALTEGLVACGVPASSIHHEAFGAKAVGTLRSAEQDVPSVAPMVTFRRSALTVRWDPAASSLLQFAEASGISVDSGCCVGSCATCVTKVTSGEVAYIGEPGEMPPAGSCLMCISVPRTDLELEA